MAASQLTADLAEHFAAVALGHVGREYPNKLDHMLAGPADARAPRALHPLFYGSLDWHSCVHGFWMLALLLRRFPAMRRAGDIATLFDARITPAAVAGECAYLQAPTARGFERPYGWAWLLKLAEELARHGGQAWSQTLRPLTEIFAQRLRDFLPRATYPVRVGTHYNTAFALRLSADYAQGAGDAALMALLRETAARWYGEDRDCPAWGEPSGDDFLSSCLIEAECMRRLMPGDFSRWFDRFLPDLALQRPANLFEPAVVADRADGKTAHLDGLNFNRAWCWRSLAAALPAGDARRPILAASAARHLAAALPHVADDYMGAHWLASFAVLALEA